MTDDELRALVRDSVARHLGKAAVTSSPRPVPTLAPRLSPPAGHASPWQQHPSHHLYVSLVGTGEACVIEPSVPRPGCASLARPAYSTIFTIGWATSSR